MSIKKQYQFFVKDRKACDGTTFPDYESPTFKNKRKAEKSSLDFDIIGDKTCGGTASISVRRTG